MALLELEVWWRHAARSGSVGPRSGPTGPACGFRRRYTGAAADAFARSGGSNDFPSHSAVRVLVEDGPAMPPLAVT
jgi:hypothetical protein